MCDISSLRVNNVQCCDNLIPSKTTVSVGNKTSGTPCILVYLQSIRMSGEMQLIKRA